MHTHIKNEIKNIYTYMNPFIVPHINTEDTMYKSTLFSAFSCTANDLNNLQQQ